MSYKVHLFAASCLVLASCHDDLNTSTSTKLQHTLTLEEILAQNSEGEKNERIVEGIQALRNKDLNTASRIFNSILLDDPKNSGLHTLNAFTYHLKSHKDDPGALVLAESGYSQAKKFDPNNVFAILELGRIKAEKGNLVGAQDEFAEVMMIDHNNKDALYEMANASYLLGDMKTALMAADRLIKVDPKPTRNLRACALIYAASGKQQQAQQCLKAYNSVETSTKQKNYVMKRVAEWQQLHKDGKIVVASANGPNFDDPATKASDEDGQSSDNQDDNNVKAASPAVVPPTANSVPTPAPAPAPVPGNVKAKIQQSLAKHPTEEMVVVDSVVLRVSEVGKTSKGKNILSNFSATLAPYTKARVKHGSTGISSFPVGALTQPSAAPSAAFGNTASSSNDGNTTLFSQGISFSNIAYSLNIANVSKNYIEVIGRPTLVAIKSKPAEFFSGTDVKVALAGQYGGNVASTPFGNTLKVTLVDIQNGFATLDVDLMGSILASSLPTDSTTNSTLIYQVGRSQIKTSVNVKLGETIMLGGTTERTESNANQGVPILKDIPLIQYFFSEETTDSERKSVMYLMTIRGYKDDKMRTIKYFNEGDDDMTRPNLTELEGRYKDWFDPQNNNIVILKSLSPLYRDFRTGDFVKLNWDFGGNNDTLEESLSQIAAFLWY